MSDTYKLDRELVKAVLRETDGQTKAGTALDSLLNTLTEQLPLQLPAGLGAIVKLEDDMYAVNADPGSDSPWVVHYAPQCYRWERTRDLPRVVEVLSAGVEVEQ